MIQPDKDHNNGKAIEKPLVVAMADDHAMIRMGFKLLLRDNFTIEEFFEASTGDELYGIIKNHKADIVLMDINMPGTNAQGILENMLLIDPGLNVLVFSMNKEEIYGKQYLKLGARAYLEKDTDPREVIKAIKCVLSGSLYIKKELQGFYLGGNNPSLSDHSPYQPLGNRELEVMRLLVKGGSLMNVAKVMNLSPSTIASHKQNIFTKLRIKNLIELKEMTSLYPI